MDGVHPQVARPALRIGAPPLGDRHLRGLRGLAVTGPLGHWWALSTSASRAMPAPL